MQLKFQPNKRFHQTKEQFFKFVQWLITKIIYTEATRFLQAACFIFILVLFLITPLINLLCYLAIAVATGFLVIGAVKCVIEVIQHFGTKGKK